jgi:hypothetical protein
MPRKPIFPLEIHTEVQKLVDEFNKEHFKKETQLCVHSLGTKSSLAIITAQGVE